MGRSNKSQLHFAPFHRLVPFYLPPDSEFTRDPQSPGQEAASLVLVTYLERTKNSIQFLHICKHLTSSFHRVFF